MTRALPIAVLASGEGTTLEGLAEEIDAGRLPARIVLVVSDRPGAHALDRARRRAIPAVLLPARGVDREAWSARLTEEVSAHRAQLVVLAGFLRIFPASWVERWRGRAINLHPALLPKYGGPGMYGHHVHEAVLAAQDAETGATVHLVTGTVDGGPILLQERIPVVPGDTPDSLRERVHPVEVRLLAEVIRRFAEGAWLLPYPDLVAAPASGREPARSVRRGTVAPPGRRSAASGTGRAGRSVASRCRVDFGGKRRPVRARWTTSAFAIGGPGLQGSSETASLS